MPGTGTPSHVRPSLTFLERVSISVKTRWFKLCGLVRAIWLWPRYRAHWPFGRLYTVSYMRARKALSDREKKYSNATTGESITSWAAENGVKHDTAVLIVDGQPDITLHELQFVQGSRTKDDHRSGLDLFFVHGGGFVSPIVKDGHLPAIRAIARALGSDRVHIPEYSLAPDHRYPTPVVQVISALRSVLRNIPPERIVLAGDSAGGNLVAAILAHIIAPSPYTSALDIDPSKPFAAALLICPYVTFHRSSSTHPPSFRLNAEHDYVTAASEPFYHILYQAKYGEVYAEPGAVSADFWRGLGNVVKRLQVTAGEWEILLDDILQFGDKLRQVKGVDVTVQVADKAMHVEFLPDLAVGLDTDETLRLVVEYCREVRHGGL